MTRKFSGVIFLSALALAACGEKVQRKGRGDDLLTPGAFAQKPATEVLNAKYNRAVVICRLWSQQSAKLNLSAAPRDTQTLDLLRDASLPKSMTLKASITNHEVTVQLDFTEIKIARLLELKDETNNKAYVAQFTPVMGLEVHYDGTSAYKGRTSKSSQATLRTIYENVPALMAALSTLPSTADGVTPFQDYVSCGLQTELKPEFSDQFVTRDLK